MKKYLKDDIIPINDFGYVIAKDAIYPLTYKYTHDYVSCVIFQDELPLYGLDIKNISIDSVCELTVIYELPLIHISRTKVPEKVNYIYSIFINTTDIQLINLLIHILFNIYGVDGSEEVDVNITINGKSINTVDKLIKILRSKQHETVKENR